MSILRGFDGTIAAAGVIGCGADLPIRRIDEDVAQMHHHRRTIAVYVLDRDFPHATRPCEVVSRGDLLAQAGPGGAPQFCVRLRARPSGAGVRLVAHNEFVTDDPELIFVSVAVSIYWNLGDLVAGGGVDDLVAGENVLPPVGGEVGERLTPLLRRSIAANIKGGNGVERVVAGTVVRHIDCEYLIALARY